MAVRFNGGIIGSRNLTTGGGVGQGTAVGIWSLNEAHGLHQVCTETTLGLFLCVLVFALQQRKVYRCFWLVWGGLS